MDTLFYMAFFFLLLGASQRVVQGMLGMVQSKAHVAASNNFADRAFACELLAIGFAIAGGVSALVS